MVMHELSKILSDLGEDVYLTITNTKLPENNSKVITQDEAMQIAGDDDCITIYPEIITGNPLNGKHVVRWVLYYPGHIGGTTAYSDDEFVFTYLKKYVQNTVYANSPMLSIFQSRANQFYDMNSERPHDAILLKKVQHYDFNQMKIKYLDPYSILLNRKTYNFDSVIHSVSGFEEMNQALNTIRYFISFDNTTYYNVLAALAGCVSIVVPMHNMNAEQWRENNYFSKYGIAYGFDDLYWAFKTQHKVKEHVLDIERDNINQAKNLIQLTKEKWNIA